MFIWRSIARLLLHCSFVLVLILPVLCLRRIECSLPALLSLSSSAANEKDDDEKSELAACDSFMPVVFAHDVVSPSESSSLY